jgi:hypothetical protein
VLDNRTKHRAEGCAGGYSLRWGAGIGSNQFHPSACR